MTPGMPGISKVGMPPPVSTTSISISLSSSSPRAQLAAETLARLRLGAFADQGVEHPFLGGEMRLRLDVLALRAP